MIFARKGDCLTCGCKVTIARYGSLAAVLRRIAEVGRCPQCGSEMAWRKIEAPELFKPQKKGAAA
jgi:hypothetical protein